MGATYMSYSQPLLPSLRSLLPLAAVLLLLPPSAEAGPEAPEVRVAKELLALPEDKLNIGEAALRLSALVDSETNVAEGQRLIGLLASQVRALVGTRTDPDYRIRAVNEVLLRRAGLGYDKVDPLGMSLDSSSLWKLLATKKGNCVSLPVLW
jgi:hypothetical protein